MGRARRGDALGAQGVSVDEAMRLRAAAIVRQTALAWQVTS